MSQPTPDIALQAVNEEWIWQQAIDAIRAGDEDRVYSVLLEADGPQSAPRVSGGHLARRAMTGAALLVSRSPGNWLILPVPDGGFDEDDRCAANIVEQIARGHNPAALAHLLSHLLAAPNDRARGDRLLGVISTIAAWLAAQADKGGEVPA